MDKNYSDRLLQYAIYFLFRMRKDIQLIEKLALKFSALDKAESFLSSISDFGIECCRALKDVGEPGPDVVAIAFESNPHFKMNMMFGMAVSKLLYDDEMRVLNAFELISLRSICIHVAVNSDCSVNSAMVTALQIPVTEVPVEIVQISRSLDEYIKAVKLIEFKVSELDDPEKYPSLTMYRDYIKGHSARIVAEVNGEGFYGTYPEYIFIEMVILRKLSPSQYPTLYGTPSMPRWEIPYDQLQQIVSNAWRARGGGSERS